jgi:hypothetical protein
MTSTMRALNLRSYSSDSKVLGAGIVNSLGTISSRDPLYCVIFLCLCRLNIGWGSHGVLLGNCLIKA